jgi:hypothetical protein
VRIPVLAPVNITQIHDFNQLLIMHSTSREFKVIYSSRKLEDENTPEARIGGLLIISRSCFVSVRSFLFGPRGPGRSSKIERECRENPRRSKGEDRITG